MIGNPPLTGNNKKITNNFARKTLVKTLKQNKTPISEILSITGHNTEARLDAHDSGDKEQQKIVLLTTVNHEPQPKQVPFN